NNLYYKNIIYIYVKNKPYTLHARRRRRGDKFSARRVCSLRTRTASWRAFCTSKIASTRHSACTRNSSISCAVLLVEERGITRARRRHTHCSQSATSVLGSASCTNRRTRRR